MQYSEIIKKVQDRANLNSDEEAARLIQATLTTLAERLAGNEASNLANQLPHEIQSYLKNVATDTGASFGMDEFIRRVALSAEIDPSQVLFSAQVVMWVVSEAITRGELNDLRQQLPQEYADLWQYTGMGLPNTSQEARQQPF